MMQIIWYLNSKHLDLSISKSLTFLSCFPAVEEVMPRSTLKTQKPNIDLLSLVVVLFLSIFLDFL